MTIIFFKEKIILLKTQKTGSTSLHYYLAKKLLEYNDFEKYIKEKEEGFFYDEDYLFTSFMSGMETAGRLFVLCNKEIIGFRVVGILRDSLEYIVSMYNHIIVDKRRTCKSLRIMRFLNKRSKKLGFIFYYKYYVKKTKQKENIIQANKKLIDSYKYYNIKLIDYNCYEELEKIIKVFNMSEFKQYSLNRFKEKDLRVIPKIVLKSVMKDFKEEINLFKKLENNNDNNI